MNSNYTTGLQHIGISTDNLDVSINFYRQLGFEVFYRTNNVVFMNLHGLLIELYESKEKSKKTSGIDHISLDTKDVDTVLSKIMFLNFTIDTEIQVVPFFGNGVRFFTIKGPNGEKIEFNQKM